MAACKKNNIRRMEYQGVIIERPIDGMSVDPEDDRLPTWDTVVEPPNIVAKSVTAEHNGRDEEVLDIIDEAEIEELMITNPQAYEEIMENTNG